MAGEGDWPGGIVLVCYILATVNSAVLIFNLIPAFPLDGGRVLRSILWGISRNLRRATFWASLAGRGFAWLLLGYAVLLLFSGAIVGAVWMGLIALFLSNAARQSYQMVVVREALRGEPVRRFMTPDPITVRSNVDLRTFVEDYVYRYHRKAFPVVDDGHLRGYVTTGDLASIPRSDWSQHSVGEVMHRDLGPVSIAPGADAMTALARMQRTGLSRLLVTDGDRLVGIVSLKDLLRFLDLKLQLEDEHGHNDQPRHPGYLARPRVERKDQEAGRPE